MQCQLQSSAGDDVGWVRSVYTHCSARMKGLASLGMAAYHHTWSFAGPTSSGEDVVPPSPCTLGAIDHVYYHLTCHRRLLQRWRSSSPCRGSEPPTSLILRDCPSSAHPTTIINPTCFRVSFAVQKLCPATRSGSPALFSRPQDAIISPVLPKVRMAEAQAAEALHSSPASAEDPLAGHPRLDPDGQHF